MDRFPAVLVSDGQYWDLLVETVNFDCLEIRAAYADISSMNPELRKQLEPVLRPIECFGNECESYVDTYFIFNVFGNMIRQYLKDSHVDKQYVISLEYPENVAFQMNLCYYLFWKFLKKNKPTVDFFTTGISFTRDGFDVPSMLPYKGITLAFLMQDMYYSYQMASEYLANCVPQNGGGAAKVLYHRAGSISVSA